MQVETVDKNKVKLTFEVNAERFEEGLQFSYNKNKNRLSLPGFRKGKVPRKMLEAQYGKEILFEDAIQFVLQDAYKEAVKAQALDVVSKPEIDVLSVSSEEGAVFTAEVYIKPEVTVTNYKGLTYPKPDVEATEEEIGADLDRAREKNARLITVTDRPVQTGDIATIDYEGFIDGVAFEGGKGEDHDLTIGSGQFIPGFEDQLVGKETGSHVQVTVTFPEEYHAETLKGKAAIFEVDIKEIKMKELPEVNDEFAQDVSEFDTLEEYKASLKAKIEERKATLAKEKKETQLLEKLVANAEMDVPAVMVETTQENMVNRSLEGIRRQGIPPEAYLQYMGQTMESLKEMYAPQAEAQVKSRLALEAVAKAEGFAVTEEEVDEEIGKMAAGYGMDKEKLLGLIGADEREQLKEDVCVRKAYELIEETAVEE